MGKCKGCQRNTVCFRLLEVCGTAEAFKNDPLSNKLITKEQFITSSQLQFLKWQVVRALSLSRSFKTLLVCQLQIHNKMQNPQLRGGEEGFVLLLWWDATVGKREAENWWRQRGGKEKLRLHSSITVYSLHLQLPSSARCLLSLKGGSVTWRGKMGGKQLI